MTTPYTITRTLERGIERITYTPHERRYETPILMQHGMWHGAWCWQGWQAVFAAWGWQTISISLPGHGGSPVQRPVRWCTLDYYLRFLRAEIEQTQPAPVVMGHSMGGALIQWYLKHAGDNLPAYVLVAPWVAHNAFADGLPLFLKLDLPGVLLCFLTLDATPYIRTPERAARMLNAGESILSPQELHEKLGPESALVMIQHNTPFWQPVARGAVRSPMLWLAGERDAVVSVEGLRKSAGYYGKDFVVIPGAAHNLMHQRNQAETAQTIHDWLVAQGIG